MFNRKRFARALSRETGQDKRKVARAIAAFDPAEIMYWATATQHYRPHAISPLGRCVDFSINRGLRIGDAHDVPTVPASSCLAQYGQPYINNAAYIDLRGPFMRALLLSHPRGLLVSDKYPEIMSWPRGTGCPNKFIHGVAQMLKRANW